MPYRRCNWLASLLLGMSFACASNNDRGNVLYADGRYVEAAEVFEHNEVSVATLDGRERARYGLYRGMTLLKLGDIDGAAKWLYYAQAQTPGSLTQPDQRALQLTWEQLDKVRAQEKLTPDPMRDAIAHSTPAGNAVAPDVASTGERSTNSLPQSGAAFRATEPNH